MKKLRVLPLAAAIFFTVSGGPYGLEPLLTYAGTHGALLLLIVTPLLWDIPAILTILELNSMMPANGGYYQWVKRALGLRFAFYEGWWTWLYTFVDLAIYPVLFVSYAAYFFPDIAHYKIPVCLVIIWLGAGLNILGVAPVGRAALVLGVLVLSPFIVLAITAAYHHTTLYLPAPSLKGIQYPQLGMALYTVMWNFFGWDNATTYAGEVEGPGRAYRKAIAIAFTTVMSLYVIVMVLTLASHIDAATLQEGGFAQVGLILGGPYVAAALSIGGMAAMLGLYAGVLLSVSRVPEVMAEDRLLPRFLTRLHPRRKTPYWSIIICAAVVSGLIVLSFADLIIMDVTLYGAGLFIEFLALIMLRRNEPDAPRPFKIRLGVKGLILLFALPVGVYLVALSGAFLESGGGVLPAVVSLAALGSAHVIWLFIKAVRKPEGESADGGHSGH